MSWWADKLGTDAPTQTPVTRPYQAQQPVPYHNSGRSLEDATKNIKVTEDNLLEATQAWKGGAGNRDASTCPACGSDLYFSRSNTGAIATQRGMATATPSCYSCGYKPGRIEQGLPPS